MTHLKLVLILGLLMLALSCSDDKDTSASVDGDIENDSELNENSEQEIELQAAEKKGPYNPAAMFAEFEDNTRNRNFSGVIWYPTKATEGEKYEYLSGMLQSEEVLKDAPIADLPPMPMIVFSHGHLAFDAQSYGLCEHLASHGYIVVACNHKEDTFTDLTNEYLIKSAMDRPKDLSVMIDTMLAWNESDDHLLKGYIDANRIGTVGHSYGGFTTIASMGGDLNIHNFLSECKSIGKDNWKEAYFYCGIFSEADSSYADDCRPCSLKDDRIKVAVSMAPAFAPFFALESLKKIKNPVLLMAGEIDDVISPVQVRQYYSNMESNAWYWELEGATHYTFSNVCDISFLSSSETFQCGEQTIDMKRAYDLVNTAATAFLGMHLKSEAGYNLYFENDYISRFEEISFEKKAD